MAWYKDKFFIRLLAVVGFLKTLLFIYIYFKNPLGEHVLIFPDSLGYVYPAQTLLTYGQFWEAVTTTPLLLRTPGYPLFLALIQLITGNLTWAVAAFQNILSLLLLIPVYLTARDLAGKIAARAGALLAASSVLYFSLSFAVLTEMLCAFLLAWFIYFSVRFFTLPRARSAMLAACFLVAAIYVRPAAYYFAPVAALFFLYTQRKHWQKILYAFVLPLFALLGIWHVRNFITTGYPGFSTVNTYNLYFWNEDFAALQQHISIPQAHEQLQAALPGNLASLPTKEQVKIYRRLAIPWLKAGWKYKMLHAPKWAAKTLLGTNFVHTSRLLLGSPDEEEQLAFQMLNQTKMLHTNYLKNVGQKLIFVFSLLQIVCVLLLGGIGLIYYFKTAPKVFAFLTIYCLYFWAVGSVFFGAYARFRAPFELVLYILTGMGITTLWQQLQSKRKRIN